MNNFELTYNSFLNTLCALSEGMEGTATAQPKDFWGFVFDALSFAALGLLAVFLFFLVYLFVLKIVRLSLPHRVYGLIGFPLGHSFSKKYFTEKFEREKVKAKYELFEIASVEGVKKLVLQNKLKGLNVTIPYKEQVLVFLDRIDPVAQDLGAVNVIKITQKGQVPCLKGYNTDVVGFENSIEKMLNPSHRKALILGTGGAAKAIEYVLKQKGIKASFVSRKARKNVLSYEMLDEETIKTHLLIINATPLGTYPKVDECPDIPYKHIGRGHLLFDVVYNPAETLFLKKGKAQGAATLNGEEMLVGQAEAAWKIWNE